MPPKRKSPDTTARTKTVFNQAGDLIDLFVMLFRNKYKREPSFNLIQTKYDVVELIGLLGFGELQEIIEFYFEIDVDRPGIRNLIYSYEEIKDMKKEREQDIADRKRLMAETKARVEAYKQREHGS